MREDVGLEIGQVVDQGALHATAKVESDIIGRIVEFAGYVFRACAHEEYMREEFVIAVIRKLLRLVVRDDDRGPSAEIWALVTGGRLEGASARGIKCSEEGLLKIGGYARLAFQRGSVKLDGVGAVG